VAEKRFARFAAFQSPSLTLFAPCIAGSDASHKDAWSSAAERRARTVRHHLL
jgi:hypothetical protein